MATTSGSTIWRPAGQLGARPIKTIPLNTAPAGVPKLPPIQTIRGVGVIIDSDLAALYGVPTLVFNQAVKRNAERFPADFLFQLTAKEVANLKTKIAKPTEGTAGLLRSQIVILKPGSRGQHRKYRPWAFTEHGAIMVTAFLVSLCGCRTAPEAKLHGRMTVAFAKFRVEEPDE